MHKIDLPMYYATLDSPGGPLIILKPDDEVYVDHIARDENGNPTVGGRIGQFIGSMILLAMFLYFWFAV